ncbi:hypothetical protein PGTUg99_019703 [Puccinia graminis f. sp. tritici]|uniref:Uncharacterized protein n=1 Tax=Puccinia graminis f. sp. tritici TaxID=56615 RepID=A0A5B0RTE9_PUCGR|nr:hypothetical protein PGTUg99_019703 [Puccinia graminis f. sp. tritici]
MKFGGAILVLVSILPSFLAAVPHGDIRTTYLQKRQGFTSGDLTTTPSPSLTKSASVSPGRNGFLGTEESGSQEANDANGSPESKGKKTPLIDAGLHLTSIPPSTGWGGDLTRDGDRNPANPGRITEGDDQHVSANNAVDENTGDDMNKVTGDAMNKTSGASLQLLQKILNHTLSTLPGLENLSDQVERMMAGELEDAVEKTQDTPGDSK